MAFRITARTLLELGAELISSDAIALYELIKNSVDAGSEVVKIRIQSVLLHSKYQQALEDIDEKVPLKTVEGSLNGWFIADSPSLARREFLSMLKEAGNNRSRFREALVKAYHDLNFIEVEDEGEGMTFEDLETVYLTIGTRSRRNEKAQWESDAATGHRIILGDKGVGRLSVMRLGDRLDVITSKLGEPAWNTLSIDWRSFSHESEALLHEVHVAPERGATKEDPSYKGMKIKISGLKSDWERTKLNTLLESEFARMVDPFDRWRANKLFRIYFNDVQITIPKIEKRLFELAHAEVNFQFHYDKDTGKPVVSGDMDYRLHTTKKRAITISEAELVAITGARPQILRALGPFDVRFIWFNRLHLTALDGIGTKKDVGQLVNKWAGGLMVFRDGYRINPYGGPDDDWLQLDKKAFARRGYKLNRNQVIGRIRLSWRNKYLIEQTNREGLVDNQYKDAFLNILKRVLEDFKTFSQIIQDNIKREELVSVGTLRERVKSAKTEIHKKIRQLAVEVPEQSSSLREVERLVTQLASHIDGVEDIISDYKDERQKFVHLASIGLMVELILHELGRASANTLGTLESIDLEVLPGQLPSTFKTLEAQLKTLQKRILSLDPLSTARRQVKEKFDIAEIVQQVVDARTAQAERHGVVVRIGPKNVEWTVTAVKGMIIQIIENLLANSFYWTKHQTLVEPLFIPEINIIIDKASKTISIKDNGPGIAISRAEEIFLPFVTSKPPGKGNGLGLYIAREMAEYHNWTLELSRVSRQNQNVLDTFILDLSGVEK